MKNKIKPYNTTWELSDSVYCEGTNKIRYVSVVPNKFVNGEYTYSNTFNITAETRKFKNPNLRKIQSILNIILREYIFAMFVLITLAGVSYLAVISLPYGGLGYMPGILLGMLYLVVRFKLIEFFERYIHDG